VADRDAGTADVATLDLGFRSEHRLHSAAEFSLVFATRRVLRSKNFDLHYRSRELVSAAPLFGARLGLVIAKKMARRAVQRNLLKRLAREVFRNARQGLPPYDLVLRLSRPTGGSLDAGARRLLRKDLEQLLSQLPA
jgi:ribonuclease P protein component